MARDTRNYRKNFAHGGTVDPRKATAFQDWKPAATAEDAAGNPTYGHYDAFGRFKPGESPEEETRNSLAHPGRTVPSVNRLMNVYPIGSHKERQKLEKAVESKYKATGEAFGYSGSGSSSELYGKTRPDTAEEGYAKGGVVKKRRR